MNAQLGLMWGAAFVVLTGSLVAAAILRKRVSPHERECQRRDLVNSRGRVIEGYINAWEHDTVEYSYQWRGVRYEAWQDVSGLVESASKITDFSGPASVKFLASRPSNSIVIAAGWSGVPGLHQQPVRPPT